MKTNEGAVDRTIRVLVGLILISLVVVGPQTAWGYLGFIPLLTGLFGYCPLYSVFGFNTCPMKSKKI